MLFLMIRGCHIHQVVANDIEGCNRALRMISDNPIGEMEDPLIKPRDPKNIASSKQVNYTCNQIGDFGKDRFG